MSFPVFPIVHLFVGLFVYINDTVPSYPILSKYIVDGIFELGYVQVGLNGLVVIENSWMGYVDRLID